MPRKYSKSTKYKYYNIRKLSSDSFSELQRLIKIVKKSGVDIPDYLPDSIADYQRTYNVSRETSRSDYIFLWVNGLQDIINSMQDKAERIVKSTDTLNVDFKKYYIEPSKGLLAKIFDDELTDYNIKTRIFGRFEQQFKFLDNIVSGRASRTRVTKRERDLLRSDPNLQHSVEDFRGSYTLLSIRNLYRAVALSDWQYVLEILPIFTETELARFWHENRSKVDITFTYDIGISPTGEATLLGALIDYAKTLGKDKKLDKLNLPEPQDLVGMEIYVPEDF